VDLALEIPKMLDFHRAKGTLMSDWLAGLRTWIRNAPGFRREGKPPGFKQHEETRPPSNYKLFPVVRDVATGVGRRVPGKPPTQPALTAEELEAQLAKASGSDVEPAPQSPAERERWEKEFRAETGVKPS